MWVAGLRETAIYRSLHRANLVLGGERELVLMTALLAAALVVTGMTWVTTGFGVVLWLVSLPIYRAMAKRDPQLSRVYLRFLFKQRYYPPRSRPWCRR